MEYLIFQEGERMLCYIFTVLLLFSVSMIELNPLYFISIKQWSIRQLGNEIVLLLVAILGWVSDSGDSGQIWGTCKQDVLMLLSQQQSSVRRHVSFLCCLLAMLHWSSSWAVHCNEGYPEDDAGPYENPFLYNLWCLLIYSGKANRVFKNLFHFVTQFHGLWLIDFKFQPKCGNMDDTNCWHFKTYSS